MSRSPSPGDPMLQRGHITPAAAVVMNGDLSSTTSSCNSDSSGGAQNGNHPGDTLDFNLKTSAATSPDSGCSNRSSVSPPPPAANSNGTASPTEEDIANGNGPGSDGGDSKTEGSAVAVNSGKPPQRSYPFLFSPHVQSVFNRDESEKFKEMKRKKEKKDKSKNKNVVSSFKSAGDIEYDINNVLETLGEVEKPKKPKTSGNSNGQNGPKNGTSSSPSSTEVIKKGKKKGSKDNANEAAQTTGMTEVNSPESSGKSSKVELVNGEAEAPVNNKNEKVRQTKQTKSKQPAVKENVKSPVPPKKEEEKEHAKEELSAEEKLQREQHRGQDKATKVAVAVAAARPYDDDLNAQLAATDDFTEVKYKKKKNKVAESNNSSAPNATYDGRRSAQTGYNTRNKDSSYVNQSHESSRSSSLASSHDKQQPNSSSFHARQQSQQSAASVSSQQSSGSLPKPPRTATPTDIASPAEYPPLAPQDDSPSSSSSATPSSSSVAPLSSAGPGPSVAWGPRAARSSDQSAVIPNNNHVLPPPPMNVMKNLPPPPIPSPPQEKSTPPASAAMQPPDVTVRTAESESQVSGALVVQETVPLPDIASQAPLDGGANSSSGENTPPMQGKEVAAPPSPQPEPNYVYQAAHEPQAAESNTSPQQVKIVTNEDDYSKNPEDKPVVIFDKSGKFSEEEATDFTFGFDLNEDLISGNNSDPVQTPAVGTAPVLLPAEPQNVILPEAQNPASTLLPPGPKEQDSTGTEEGEGSAVAGDYPLAVEAAGVTTASMEDAAIVNCGRPLDPWQAARLDEQHRDLVQFVHRRWKLIKKELDNGSARYYMGEDIGA